MTDHRTIEFRNEFANIRISTEEGRCGMRLKVTDLETSASTYIDPLELAGLCQWPEEERRLVVYGHMYGRELGGESAADTPGRPS